MGTLLSGAHFITDGMLQAAAEWYGIAFLVNPTLFYFICTGEAEFTLKKANKKKRLNRLL